MFSFENVLCCLFPHSVDCYRYNLVIRYHIDQKLVQNAVDQCIWCFAFVIKVIREVKHKFIPKINTNFFNYLHLPEVM